MQKRIFAEIIVNVPDHDPGFMPELDICLANTNTELAHRSHPSLTSLIQYIITHLQGSPCDCCGSGYFSTPVPGVIGRIENGKIADHAKVERCDHCACFETDAQAETALRLYMSQADFFTT